MQSEVSLKCKNYWLGHKWSEIPPKKGFATWCVRCEVRHPRFGFDYHENQQAAKRSAALVNE